MTDNRHKVEWRKFGTLVKESPSKYEFIWLYGSEKNELLLHKTSNVHLAPASIEQIERATHWAPGPNPHYDEIYLPFPPEED